MNRHVQEIKTLREANRQLREELKNCSDAYRDQRMMIDGMNAELKELEAKK